LEKKGTDEVVGQNNQNQNPNTGTGTGTAGGGAQPALAL